MLCRPATSTLFPYTTLFRSLAHAAGAGRLDGLARRGSSTDDDEEPAGPRPGGQLLGDGAEEGDRKSTRLNSSHSQISYAVFCLKKKNKKTNLTDTKTRHTIT